MCDWLHANRLSGLSGVAFGVMVGDLEGGVSAGGDADGAQEMAGICWE
jgi:hypothetical protein